MAQSYPYIPVAPKLKGRSHNLDLDMSCQHPPQTVSGAPLSLSDVRWNASECSYALDFWNVNTGTGRCCTEEALDGVDAYIASRVVTAACLQMIARLRCSTACSPELNDWWDPERNVPHLCTKFCTRLWSQCYAADPQHSDRDVFCKQYYTGPGRPEPSACLADDLEPSEIVVSIPITVSEALDDYFELFGGPTASAISPPPQYVALMTPMGGSSGEDDHDNVPPTAIAAPLCIALVLLVIFIFWRHREKLRHSSNCLNGGGGGRSHGGSVSRASQMQQAAAVSRELDKQLAHPSYDHEVNRDGKHENNDSIQEGKGGLSPPQHTRPLREGPIKGDPFLDLIGAIADESTLTAGRPKVLERSLNASPCDGGAEAWAACPIDTRRRRRMLALENAPEIVEELTTKGVSSSCTYHGVRRHGSVTLVTSMATGACVRRGPSESLSRGRRAVSSQQKLLSPEAADALVCMWSQRLPTASAILYVLPHFGPPIASWKWKEVLPGDHLSPRSLQHGFRRAAAVLHPDKTRNWLERERKLAEELFKLLTQAYQREMDLNMDLNA